MARKLFVFLTGMATLSAAWIGVTSSVQTFQEDARRESTPIKQNLLQTRWNRLANFQAFSDEVLQKPARFSFTFSGLDLVLTDSQVAEGIRSDLYLDAKKAYLDAGQKVDFLTFQAMDVQDSSFLVRIQKEQDRLELIGFSLDMILNYLGNGLGKSEWFLVDGTKRVLASDEKAYVGKRYKINKLYDRLNFKVNDRQYTVAILKPRGINVVMTNAAGIIGIALVLMALFIYTGGSVDEAEVQVTTESEEGAGRIVQEESVQNKIESTEEPSKSVFDDLDEEVRMVDLSASKKSRAAVSPVSGLDYTDFLMDNPVLGQGEKSSQESNLVGELETTETASMLSQDMSQSVNLNSEPQVKMDQNPADDWVKLAEELSASIDEFTKSREKKEPSSSKADA